MFSLGAGCWIEGRGSCEEQQGVEEAGAEEIGNKPTFPTQPNQPNQTQIHSPSQACQALLHHLFEEFPSEKENSWQGKEVRFWGLFPSIFYNFLTCFRLKSIYLNFRPPRATSLRKRNTAFNQLNI